ncbi:hypothetical protein HYH02_000912 [Chlamydomonas schloesseri]|uniref:Cation efflux protein cytoplasmic domain-containing protein n=1 Tax=Chlamydomonas schloesseri TaxID=2026947 RepID=A0A836BD45_9CHLO|nr:hypothetical protein HYH02_000912 [Chlamydomonas schloesseri]|eukprot:KAG2455092.1 hypothetical protein HYH02_000912 [Chlamydomonas schloesseri]
MAAEEPSSSPTGDPFARKVRIGINASWVVNILLLVAKTVVFILSGSYAVLASAVDSLVDLLSQVVLAVAEYQAATYDRRFPIGRTRMAELSVLACAAIMFVSTSLVIREAADGLWDGFHGEKPPLDADVVLFVVLGGATACKLGLYLYCVTLKKNPIMVALSQDHLNDVQSNLAAIFGAALAAHVPRFWYVDPIVALVFSVLIIKSWMGICWEQGQKMIGLGAPDDLVQEVIQLGAAHHPNMQLDRVTAYHHGSNMVVEVEVLLPPDMSVRESNDIAQELQHKVEALDSVERAYVHVDWTSRSLHRHKVERNLKVGERDVMKPLPSGGLTPALSRATSTAPPTPPADWRQATVAGRQEGNGRSPSRRGGSLSSSSSDCCSTASSGGGRPAKGPAGEVAMGGFQRSGSGCGEERLIVVVSAAEEAAAGSGGQGGSGASPPPPVPALFRGDSAEAVSLWPPAARPAMKDTEGHNLL